MGDSLPAGDPVALPAPPPAPAGGLGRVALAGTVWTAVGIYGSSVLGLAATAVLARMVGAREFGIVAAALAIIDFFATLGEHGIGGVVVQRARSGERALSTLFWASLAAGAAAGAGVALAAPLAAAWIGAPEVGAALRLMGLNLLGIGLMMVPLALLRAQLRFGVVAASQTMAVAVGGVVAIALAAAGYGFLALVAQSVAVVAARTALVWARCGWRPRHPPRLGDLRGTGGYTGPLFGTVVVNYWSRNLDALLIGHFLGMGALGYTSLARRLVGVPLQLATVGMRSLMHPIFAAMEGDVARMRRAYLRLVRSATLVSLPLAALLWYAAEPLVALVWGDAWLPSVGILRGMLLLLALQPVTALAAPVYLARGETRWMLWGALLQAGCVVAGMALGLPWGAAGVAWGYSLAYVGVVTPVAAWVVQVRLLGGRPGELLRALRAPAAAGAAVLLASFVAVRLMGGTGSALTLLVLTAAAAAAFGPVAYAAHRRAPLAGAAGGGR